MLSSTSDDYSTHSGSQVQNHQGLSLGYVLKGPILERLLIIALLIYYSVLCTVYTLPLLHTSSNELSSKSCSNNVVIPGELGSVWNHREIFGYRE
jgi:hypothetical protein